jgi:phage major head subunit gpT-like protein
MGVETLGSRAIIGNFYAALEAYTGSNWIAPISMFFGNSDMETETYKWLGMTPALREWIGGRQAKGLRANGIDIKNKTWEGTLVIPVDWIRRDKTGQINVRIQEFAGRAAELDSKLVSNLINSGNGNTYGNCYDGQYFFDTDHSEGDSGTQTNNLDASDVSDLNVSGSTAPTVAEMNAAVLGVIQHMYGFKDDQGEPINANAKSFLVMVPTNMMGAAMGAVYGKIINAATGAYDNVLANAAREQGFNVQAVCNPRLTGTSAFYVFRTDAPAKPFIRQEEEPLSVDAIAEGSEHAFKNNEYLYGVKRICNVGYGYWQYAAKATLS